MRRTLFLLKNVSDFAPGAFENTAVEDGSVQLGRSAGTYLHSGCYTSPAFQVSPFLQLIPSWNASTPRGTAVEVQVRVAAGGSWSRWFGFGKWSPFIRRGSPPPQADEIAKTEAELLQVEQGASADMAQVRIFLYSDDQMVSPKVQLLAVAIKPIREEEREASRTERLLQIPAYSALVRDPAIANRIASPTSLSMLMNRWGKDTLPEEVARAAYDTGAGKYGNLSFITAIAGSYGYECYMQYTGVETLRQEVRRGNAAGANVRYRAPALGEEEQEKEVPPSLAGLPVLEGAAADSHGHLLVVRGFVKREGEEWVVLNDPLAPADSEVMKEMSLERFEKIYTGLCMVLHKGPKEARDAAPRRMVGEISQEGDDLQLTAHGEEIYPGKIKPKDASLLTVCYTLPEGVAYASAAQKKFYYLAADESGQRRFDPKAMAGKKAAFYFIGNRGDTWVAEKEFSAAEPSGQ